MATKWMVHMEGCVPDYASEARYWIVHNNARGRTTNEHDKGGVHTINNHEYVHDYVVSVLHKVAGAPSTSLTRAAHMHY